MDLRKFLVYGLLVFLEILVLYLYFIVYNQWALNVYKKQQQEIIVKKLDYCISKYYLKPMLMCIRDYIIFGGDIKELISKREGIEGVLKNNFLTADAYFLSKSLLDDQNRPIYLRNAKISQDIYIKNIASVYYYCLVTKQISEALGSSYEELKKNNSYKWIIDLLEKPVLSIAKNYIINKLKETAKTSTDNVATSLSLGLLIALDYQDERFYNHFLGSNAPVVFVTSTVGLYITGKKSTLKDYSKYYYFFLNKPDLYRYYGILLIFKYTSISQDVYKKILDFEIIKDYKECAIALVMLLN